MTFQICSPEESITLCYPLLFRDSLPKQGRLRVRTKSHTELLDSKGHDDCCLKLDLAPILLLEAISGKYYVLAVLKHSLMYCYIIYRKIASKNNIRARSIY